MTDDLVALRTSLRTQLASLRGVHADAVPGELLDVTVQRLEHPGGPVYWVRPADWDALRDEEGAAGRGVPYWATPWPAGTALAAVLGEAPPAPDSRVLELGAGLALPGLAAARSGARVLITDSSPDAVAFAAHSLALSGLDAEVAVAAWDEHGEALVRRGPWDLVLAADVLYTRANVEAALRLLPRLLGARGEALIADPDRAGAREFLDAARAMFHISSEHDGKVAVHRLRRRA